MPSSKTHENLLSLYAHCNTGFSVETSKKVAEKVSACDKRKSWKWRYFLSLKNGMKLRPQVSKAINKAHAKLKPPKPKPLPHEPGKHTIVVWGPKTKVDEYRNAVPKLTLNIREFN